MSATRKQLFALLDRLEIEHTTREHPPVYTVEQAKALRGDIPGGHCKNLFLKDKKGRIWLVVCLEDTPVDLKALPGIIGSARISFGKPALLKDILGVEPGSVTPFALINDQERKTGIVLEKRMMDEQWLSFHPLANNATTTLSPRGLMKFVGHCGHECQICDLAY